MSPYNSCERRNRVETTDHLKTNREFKDRLFRLIFNPKENREFLLNLYNAVRGTLTGMWKILSVWS